MKSYKELFEMSPQLNKNDWDEGVANLGSISEYVTNNKWELLKTPKGIDPTLEFRKLKQDNVFILGNWNEQNRFKVIFQIDLVNVSNIGHKLDYKKLYAVSAVALITEFQGRKIATNIYKHFIDNNGTLLSDKKQYIGAAKLWTRLSRENECIVDIVDIKNNLILETDVSLELFNNKYWSEGKEKQHIRFVLKMIK